MWGPDFLRDKLFSQKNVGWAFQFDSPFILIPLCSKKEEQWREDGSKLAALILMKKISLLQDTTVVDLTTFVPSSFSILWNMNWISCNLLYFFRCFVRFYLDKHSWGDVIICLHLVTEERQHSELVTSRRSYIGQLLNAPDCNTIILFFGKKSYFITRSSGLVIVQILNATLLW